MADEQNKAAPDKAAGDQKNSEAAKANLSPEAKKLDEKYHAYLTGYEANPTQKGPMSLEQFVRSLGNDSKQYLGGVYGEVKAYYDQNAPDYIKKWVDKMSDAASDARDATGDMLKQSGAPEGVTDFFGKNSHGLAGGILGLIVGMATGMGPLMGLLLALLAFAIGSMTDDKGVVNGFLNGGKKEDKTAGNNGNGQEVAKQGPIEEIYLDHDMHVIKNKEEAYAFADGFRTTKDGEQVFQLTRIGNVGKGVLLDGKGQNIIKRADVSNLNILLPIKDGAIDTSGNSFKNAVGKMASGADQASTKDPQKLQNLAATFNQGGFDGMAVGGKPLVSLKPAGPNRMGV